MDEKTEEQIILMQIDILHEHLAETARQLRSMLILLDTEYAKGTIPKEEYVQLKMAYSEMLDTARTGLASTSESAENIHTIN